MASVEVLESSATIGSGGIGRGVLTWSARALVVSAWVSAGLFGLYILAFYAAAALDGNLAR